jgi:starch phosphorylase
VAECERIDDQEMDSLRIYPARQDWQVCAVHGKRDWYDLKSRGYRAHDFYEGNSQLKGVIDLISSGYFSSGDSELFKPLVDSLLYHDEYLLFADYQSYVDCQERVSKTCRNRDAWTRMSILNVARMGKFSSDRTIRQYCGEIWKVSPVPVLLEDYDEEES